MKHRAGAALKAAEGPAGGAGLAEVRCLPPYKVGPQRDANERAKARKSTVVAAAAQLEPAFATVAPRERVNEPRVAPAHA